MAMSYQFANQRLGHSLRQGRSSSQASLAKILRTISTFSPRGGFKERDSDAKFGEGLFFGERGFGLDLNSSVGDSVMANEDSFLCEGSTVVGVNFETETPSAPVPPRVEVALEASSDGECESKSEQELEFTEITEPIEVLIESEGRVAEEVSRITNLQVESEKAEEEREEDDKEKTKTESFWRNEDGYIGMLIEAAEVIESDERGEEKEGRRRKGPSNNGGSLVNRELAGANVGGDGESEKRVGPRLTRAGLRKQAREQCFGTYKEEEEEEEDNDDDVSPVVKSKRGRSQVLPYRFRDSVLEPWKPLTRPRANPVPTRRRSRR